MDTLIVLQRWLHQGIGAALGGVVSGEPRAIWLALATAFLFGILHALMPGHGKSVLVSYHLGQQSTLAQSVFNGSVLALTHVGLALVLLFMGFAVISKAFAYGGRTPQFELASGVLITLIGGFLVLRSVKRSHSHHSSDGHRLAFATGLIPCPLTTFIMSYAMARGLVMGGLAVTGAMTVGMIVTIAGTASAARFARVFFVGLMERTESWRHGLGLVLEIGGAIAVTFFGVYSIAKAYLY